MIEDINYKGLTTSPSDYDCSDGELAGVSQMITEDGVRPVFPAAELFKLPAGKTVMYMHETTSFKHYVIKDESNGLQWTSDGLTLTDLYSFSGKQIYQINAIGNTLVVLTSDGMYYFLWKSDSYKSLGTEIPELPISFGLQGEVKRTDQFSVSADKPYASDTDQINFTDAATDIITPAVLAKVNKFIADNTVNAGKFIFPFIVRYAYRMYDGSLTKHSAPCLMLCSSGTTPHALIVGSKNDNGNWTFQLRVTGVCHSLDYCVDASAMSELQDWKDVITSVDIYVSRPIYTYDQSGKCNGTDYMDVPLHQYEEINPVSVCKLLKQTASTAVYPQLYQAMTFSAMYALTYKTTDNITATPNWTIIIPRRSVDDVNEDIKNCSQFFLLHSYKIDELATERTLVDIKDNYLQSLVNREAMTDDYDSHDKITPRYSYIYNSRINIANIKKSLFPGFNPSAITLYVNGKTTYTIGPHKTLSTLNSYDYAIIDDKATVDTTSVPIDMYVYINQGGKSIVVKSKVSIIGKDSPFVYIYYPNTNAYKAILRIDSIYYEIKLEPHKFLNGSFYYGGMRNNPDKVTTVIPTVTDVNQSSIDLLNKIYTSDVNNPFYFPLKGINTVGTGTILAICSAVKALSQGQFGQFPLYAFTTEGVWALEVSSTGTYSARQPVTRDVCDNQASITQLDSAVLFSTDRGLMILEGSQSSCISEILNNVEAFDISPLPHIDELITTAGLKKEYFTYVPFREYLKQSASLYDYANQRIIVYSSNYSYAYVYSLESKKWGTLASDIASSVNSYPGALAMTKDNILKDYSSLDYSKRVNGMFITRPIKIGSNDLKTIDCIIQRGRFKKGDIRTALYASRDLYNWQLVWTSQSHYLRGFSGSPFKYFRIAVLCNFDKGESVNGCTINYKTRLTDQPR